MTELAVKEQIGNDNSMEYFSASVAAPNREESNVVLFSGGYNASSNRPFYYYNIKKMYEIINGQYGVDASHIYILYADGVSETIDNSLGESSDMSFAADSMVLAATKENLRSVFYDISVAADGNDHFLFYSFDHGVESLDGTDYLCGWGEMIEDTEFTAYASELNAGYQTYIMSQCYAWGMLEEIAVPSC